MSDDNARGREQSRVQPSYSRTTEGTAIAALVCAILSWVAVPIILAVVALVLAKIAQDKIDDSRGTLGGDGVVTAARVIAWLNLALAALLLLLLIAGIVVFVAID